MAKKKKKKEIIKLKTYCEACLKRQIKVDGVVTCRRGHDGPVGLSKEELDNLKECKNRLTAEEMIHVQIGDQEDDIFYRIMGGKGESFILRAYKLGPVRKRHDGTKSRKEVVIKTYHANLKWICKYILHHEIAEKDILTLKQLLVMYEAIEQRLSDLSDKLYHIREEGANK